MYFEFTLADLEEIKSELDSIEQEINEAINSTLVYVQPTSSYTAGHFSTEVIAGLEDKNNNLHNIMTTVQTFSDRLQDTIDKIEYTETVNDHEQLFIYDPEVLNTKLNQINDLLSTTNTDCSMIFKMGQEYESWESRTTLKLDNPDASLFGDAIEEAKQQDDEKVFRHNRGIMQSLDSKLFESLGDGYINNLENIEAIREKLDGLEILDEIQDIKEIIFNSTEAGVAPNASESASIMDSQEVSETVVVESSIVSTIIKKIILSSDFYVEVLVGFVANMKWDKLGDKILDIGIELYEKINLNVDLPWLKAIPFGAADFIGAGFHLWEYINGNLSGYEFGQQITGDIGSLIGDKTGLVVGAGISELLLGAETGGLVGIVGGLGGSIGGSMLGEAKFENIYEDFVIEDDDNTIHWIWED